MWFGLRDNSASIVEFTNDRSAISVLTPTVTEQQLNGVIAYFERDLSRVKADPRLGSYYAAAISMLPLFQERPLDKQASSIRAEVLFSEVTTAFPTAALPHVLEAISLAKSPAFLQLDAKAYNHLRVALRKCETDADDGGFSPENREALGLLIGLVPIFEAAFEGHGRADLLMEPIRTTASRLLDTHQ